MSRRINVARGTPREIKLFVGVIVSAAVSDHLQGKKSKPTGYMLCEEHAVAWRGFHERLATTIYNTTRHSLELAAKEAQP